MNMAVYIRVSTQEQAIEGYSIEAQKERLESYCKAKGWTLAAEYVDAGFSGANLNRPELQQMLSDISMGLFEGVLVYKLDRLSRSQKDTLYLIEDVFLKNNISFVSLNENFDTSTAFGRAMIGILSVFAQLEREQIKERTRMGLETRIKNGKKHGYAPFGYRYVDKQLVVVPEEAEVVRDIFNLLAKEYTYKQITDYIVKTYPQYEKFSSSKANRVQEIAHIITYAGYVKFGNVTALGNHEPIISQELYEKVSEILKNKHEEWEKNRTKRTGTHSHYLLTGFVFCGQCGARFRAIPKHYSTPPLYKCYSRIGHPTHMVRDRDCKAPYYSTEELDNIIINELYKLKNDKNYFNSLKKNPTTSTAAHVLERNTNELNSINTKINKLLDLYTADNIDVAILSAKIKELTDRKQIIEKTISDINKQVQKKPIEHDDIYNMLSNLDYLISNEATDELRQLLQILLDKVIISDEGIIIQWKF